MSSGPAIHTRAPTSVRKAVGGFPSGIRLVAVSSRSRPPSFLNTPSTTGEPPTLRAMKYSTRNVWSSRCPTTMTCTPPKRESEAECYPNEERAAARKKCR